MVEAYNPPEIWQPFGAFSMAVLQGQGRIVWLKGQVALDKERRVVGPGDMQLQVRQVLENLKAVLAGFGGEMGDILSLTAHTTDIEGYIAASGVRRQYFSAPFPATTTVQVVRLIHPALMIEISGVAEIPLERFRKPEA
jgi:enamine deaminase RidA (YjgF/YER057c/UK114 family)